MVAGHTSAFELAAALSQTLRQLADASAEVARLPQVVADHVAATVNGSCVVILTSEDGATLAPVAICPAPGLAADQRALLDRLRHARPVRTDGSNPLAAVVRRGRPLVLRDGIADALRARFADEADHAVALGLDIRWLMVAPLHARGTDGGAVVVFRHGPTAAPFTEVDEQIVTILADHAALAVANARLLAESGHAAAARNRRSDRMHRVLELTREFSAATADQASLLELIADRLRDLVGGDACRVRLLDADGRFTGDNAVAIDPGVDAARRAALARLSPERVGEGISGRVAMSRRSILIADEAPATLASRTEPRFVEPVITLGLRGVLAVPLMADDAVTGVATVLRWRPDGRFTEDDLEIAEAVAGHAGLAIANARLLDARRSALNTAGLIAARLRALSSVSRELAAASHDTAALLELAARRLGELVGQMCTVRLVSDDGEQLEAATGLYHPAPGDVAPLLEVLRDSPQRRGEGAAGRVMATGVAVVQTGTPAELVAGTVEPYTTVVKALGVTSYLTAPLRSGNRVIAVAILGRVGASPPFSTDDVEFVEELGRHVALAIDNSRLWASLARELDERRRAEAELRTAQDQFRQAQKMEAIGRLAGGVAHDFNNLLSVILVNATMLRERAVGDDAADLDEIVSASERAAALTRQLLAFSRRQITTRRVIDLNAVVADTERMIRRIVGEDIRVTTALAPGPHPVEADPGQLGQVLLNLVVNARDAMPGGGALAITTSGVDPAAATAAALAPGAWVELTVRDTGSGIAPDAVSRIFEPYFTTKAVGQGTGLGLSTVLGIVQQCGGDVRVDSAPGAGATFRVYLPRTDAAPRSVEAPPPIADLGGCETILLVEDDAAVRATVVSILRKAGYTLLEADGAEAALALDAAGRDYALLITDMVMPGIGGRALADRLRARRPALPVLFISGYTGEAVAPQTLERPGVALLEKPFPPAALLQRVRGLLGAPA